jgi:ribosomal protein L11 methyltransferase|tara:strand:- start:2247 stop:3077 length:831 start_codon:yes stop_codon:yes gene_type:complete
MEYIEVDIEIEKSEVFSDIVVARLNEIEFETFLENDNGVRCYIQAKLFDKKKLDIELDKIKQYTKLNFNINHVAQKNWNEEWEKNFKPVQINSHCLIRSEFHNNSGNFKDEIIITPKMSFGTGHHETTFLMINELYNLDLNDKSILDMGSGTGVLSIVASKNGAKQVVGIDIDEWAFQNSIDNAKLNNTENISFLHGDIKLIENQDFDIILANINRNIIEKDIEEYYNLLSDKGDLLISGFLVEDVDFIINLSINNRFNVINKKNKGQWSMVHLRK